MPEHWVTRLVAREEALRTGNSNSFGAGFGVSSMLEKLEAAEWKDSGLGLNTILADGQTLYHRAASQWPDALAAMMEVEPPQPVVDSKGMLAYEILARDWDGDHFRPTVEAMKACVNAYSLQQGLPGPEKSGRGPRM